MVSGFSEVVHRGPPPAQPVPWSGRIAGVGSARSPLPAALEHTEITLLKPTIGSQNYLLPQDADADSIRSIVIWCEPVRFAYTAASLKR